MVRQPAQIIAVVIVALCSQAHCETIERSFWISVTLSPALRGYWSQDPTLPESPVPSYEAIRNTVTLLANEYHADRLYLVYHRQCSLEAAREALLLWHKALPAGVTAVPTFLPLDYSAGLDAGQAVFSAAELADLARWCEVTLKPPVLALYDVYPDRPWDWAIAAIREGCSLRVGHVGIQPLEAPKPGLDFVVVDTWGAVSAGRTNEDWARVGRPLLEQWVRFPRPGLRVVFNLIAVAWDYDYSLDGTAAPPYDDERDDPLAAGRNTLAAHSIRLAADPIAFAGFSSDLTILQSHTLAHGEDLYADLAAGRRYTGRFAGPLDEIGSIYAALSAEDGPS